MKGRVVLAIPGLVGLLTMVRGVRHTVAQEGPVMQALAVRLMMGQAGQHMMAPVERPTVVQVELLTMVLAALPTAAPAVLVTRGLVVPVMLGLVWVLNALTFVGKTRIV